jgi:hypothetical protein
MLAPNLIFLDMLRLSPEVSLPQLFLFKYKQFSVIPFQQFFIPRMIYDIHGKSSSSTAGSFASTLPGHRNVKGVAV